MPRSVTTLGRTISKCMPGTDRQPSLYDHSPDASTISGLMIACGPSPVSYVKMRRCTPIWGAARPRPRASYIVSYMLSASPTRLPFTSWTSRERCFRTGSPKTRTGCVAMWRVYRRPSSARTAVKKGSHPEGIHVDAQATVLAGRGEIDLGERVAERVGGFRLDQRSGRRSDGDRPQYVGRVHGPQRRARDVHRVGRSTQLRQSPEGRKTQD